MLERRTNNHTLLLSLAALTLLLIALGSYVRATGAGMACPDWPLCFGKAVPKFEGGVIQEVLHRYLASIIGLLTVIFAISAWRRQRRDWVFAKFLLLVLLVQIVLGGLTVLMTLNPIIVTLHLTFGTIFFQTVLLTLFSQQQGSYKNERLAKFTKVTAIICFLQLVSGGFVGASGASLVCEGFPLCGGELLPSIGSQLAQMFHRLLGFVLAFHLVWLWFKWGRKSVGRVRSIITYSSILVLLQIVVGIGNLHARITPPLTIVHLIIAELILGGLLVLYVEVYPRDELVKV